MLKKVILEELKKELNQDLLEKIEGILSTVKDVRVKKLGEDVLDIIPDVLRHSWVGSRGTEIHAVSEKTTFPYCNVDYSDNGKMSYSPTEGWTLGDHLIGQGVKVRSIKLIIIRNWDNYNNPSVSYDQFTVYLRPNYQLLEEKLNLDLSKKINRLGALIKTHPEYKNKKV